MLLAQGVAFGVPCSPLATVLHARNLFPSRHYALALLTIMMPRLALFRQPLLELTTLFHMIYSRTFLQPWQQPVLLATGPEFHARTHLVADPVLLCLLARARLPAGGCRDPRSALLPAVSGL